MSANIPEPDYFEYEPNHRPAPPANRNLLSRIFIIFVAYGALGFTVGFTAGLAIWLFIIPAHAEDGFPPIKIVDSCATFAAIPRALANCEDNETTARFAASQYWAITPERDQGQCQQLAAKAPHNRFEVLRRCLRVAISEDAWKRTNQ